MTHNIRPRLKGTLFDVVTFFAKKRKLGRVPTPWEPEVETRSLDGFIVVIFIIRD